MGITINDSDDLIAGPDQSSRPACAIATPLAGAVRWRVVALPVEHGGWGLLLEPIALGLLVAPSWAGMFVSIAAAGAFLARHPLRLAMADRRRGRRFPRTPIAELFALLYGGVAILSLGAALAFASSYIFLLPVALAAPLALVQIWYDASGRGRRLFPELAGSIAMAATVASLALAAGWPRLGAFALWALVVARFIPAILYVRSRILELHRKPSAPLAPVIAHVVALAAVIGIAVLQFGSKLAIAAFVILFARAGYGLAGLDRAKTAKALGFREVAFGVMTIAILAAGYRLGQ